MYVPKAFLEERIEVLHEAIRQARVGDLVTMGSDGLESTLLPLLIEQDGGKGRLVGHLARANRQWKRYDPGLDALVIFRGPNAYISPTFYPRMLRDGKVVPTWDYIAVHAYGRLVVHDDRAAVDRIVRRLTTEHEAEFSPSWSVEAAPPEYIESELRAIVGIEITIDRLVGSWKLTQNHDADDIEGVIAALRAGSPQDQAVAAAVRAAGARKLAEHEVGTA